MRLSVIDPHMLFSNTMTRYASLIRESDRLAGKRAMFEARNQNEVFCWWTAISVLILVGHVEILQ